MRFSFELPAKSELAFLTNMTKDNILVITLMILCKLHALNFLLVQNISQLQCHCLDDLLALGIAIQLYYDLLSSMIIVPEDYKITSYVFG